VSLHQEFTSGVTVDWASRQVVEYYDARGASLFYDTMNNKPAHGGILELRFIWDEMQPSPTPPYVPSVMPHELTLTYIRGTGRDGRERNADNGPRGGERGRRPSPARNGRDGGRPDNRNGNGRDQYGDRGMNDNRGPDRRDSMASQQGPFGRYNEAPPQVCRVPGSCAI
jgi:hypothetical protein